jgi:opine dehydrogenase
VLEAVCDAYPQFIPAPNVLHTSLDNMGAIFHPTLTLLNAGWIERTKGDFQFYIDGVTRSTAHVLEVLDRERVTIASALGVHARPALRWLKDAYSAKGDTLYESIQTNPGYQGIKAPRNLHHRYIFEDVPFSLVPMASLGAQFGVETRAIDAMVRLACVAHGTNYCQRGRTTEDMGLKGLRVSEVKRYVREGWIRPVYVVPEAMTGSPLPSSPRPARHNLDGSRQQKEIVG